MTRLLSVALVMTAVAALLMGWRGSAANARAERLARELAAAEDAVEDLSRALDAERARAAEVARIGAEHEEARRDAETVPAAVAADLRAGTLRLRREWASCETARLSDAAAAAAERDALAGLRAEAAGRIVRIGRDADDQLRACQAVIRAYRGESGQ